MLTGCTLLTTFDKSKQEEDTFQRCRDRTDNDADGLTDCDDPGCAQFGICSELTPDSCADSQDNDNDGLTDCEDPGCTSLPGVCVERTLQTCTDGKDNDNDGRIDCQDNDCHALDVCQELTSVDCTDGEDNDKDGLVDCNDFDCYQQLACCTIKVPPFTGDTFSHKSSCSIHTCVQSDPTCCDSGYQVCNPFDPDRWVVWGLPRPRQDNAFVTNEPCGCEASGIVSVERVPLATGAGITFNLSLEQTDSSVCGGYTVSNTFTDDLSQCSGAPQPRLLLGVCLAAMEQGAPRVAVLVDGQVQKHANLSREGPVGVAIDFRDDGAEVTAGPIVFRTPSPGTGLPDAMVLVYGQGNGGRLNGLKLAGTSSKDRCRSPGTWYRHMGRGEPVVRRDEKLLEASHPTVVYLPETKTYLMLLSGTNGQEGGYGGIYSATSTDGTQWAVSQQPVFPASAVDKSFGASQSSPSLLFREGKFHVWYTREDQTGSYVQRGIAYATSADGETWKAEAGPGGQPYVFEPGPAMSWDSLEVSAPCVIGVSDGTLLMWYTGIAANSTSLPAIGVAASKDGTTWQRLQLVPVLVPDPDDADLALEDPAVLYDAATGLYRMWYTHRAFGMGPVIRHAVSANGLAWNRWPDPVLVPGNLGTFDERGVAEPTLLVDGYRLKLWYAGLNSSGAPQIGYAENRGQR